VPRRVRGDRAFRRLITKLPDVVRQEIVGQMKVTGTQVLAQQRSLAPFRTGATKNALSMRILPKSLKLKVGILGKPLNRQLFYAHIIEFGRKAQTVSAKRANGASYSMRISALPPRNFIYFARDPLYQPFRNIWDRALQKAASGISDD
jgi:hypothetical protein